jgi:uncharacterized protein Usg
MERPMVASDFRRQMQGFGLTTANIFYRMPDHPAVLQSYIWQTHDLHPHFPELQKFLQFWRRELEGALHSVIVSHCRLIKPAEFRAVNEEFRLN